MLQIWYFIYIVGVISVISRLLSKSYIKRVKKSVLWVVFEVKIFGDIGDLRIS